MRGGEDTKRERLRREAHRGACPKWNPYLLGFQPNAVHHFNPYHLSPLLVDNGLSWSMMADNGGRKHVDESLINIPEPTQSSLTNH